MHRLPTEILGEIFKHCVNTDMNFDPLDSVLWSVVHVSRRWRATALASPQLWRHFNFGPGSDDESPPDVDSLVPAVILQLQWSTPALLICNFN
ncbi:hypothetical protein C8R43DRAFT_1012854 [Mycena crocata]|nr:hypothetical protein C8R43DRAFT_1012854 [Mycena crocata]